jgi:lipopolysaccharide export system protein LptA
MRISSASLSRKAALYRGFHRAAVAIAAIAALASPAAYAEKADHDKPTNIVYDRANWDDLKQVYVFTGNVILTKGTIVVRSDKLVVRIDPEGYDFGTATMDSPGRQVYFHQKREGYADQYIEGVGDRIEYDEKADEVKIFTKAVVKRLDSCGPQDEMRGDTIDYNSLTEIYHVESGKTGLPAHAIIAPAKPVTQTPAPCVTPTAAPGASSKPATTPAGTAPPATSGTATSKPPGAGTTSTPVDSTPPVTLQPTPSIGTTPR